MYRTVFLDKNDMKYGSGFDRIEQLSVPEYSAIDVNDAIEFFEIKRYFDDGIRKKGWTDDQYIEYKEKSKKLFGLTMQFFNKLSDTNIIYIYEQIEEGYFYNKSFWILFNSCKLYKTISTDTFDRLLHTERVSLFDMLIHKEISKQYGIVIRDFIMESLNHISLLMCAYEQDYIPGKEKLHLPTELNKQDIEKYFQAYIDSDFPNLNYLKSIVQMRDKSPFCVSDSIRLKAKRRYEEKSQEFFEKGNSYKYGLEIIFSSNQEKLKLVKKDGRNQVYSYSTEWLQETLDLPSVLNNFIYAFEFVDVPQMRCLLVAKESQSRVFERAMQSKSERIYPTNTAFKLSDRLTLGQTALYYDFLKKNSIRLEEVLEWLFTKHLQEAFKCSEMRIVFPSEGASFSEKCTSICAAFESAIKQFSLFVEHGQIDFELLALSSVSKRIGDIPSLVENKYIYGVGKEFEIIKFILFSDQCLFSHVKRIYDEGRLYDCFFDLLINEDIFLSDYHDYEQKTFHWLAGLDVLVVNKEGLIKLGNPWKVTIVRDLFKHDVISYQHYPSESFPVFQEWIDKGFLETKSSLFSRPEADYYNFILNDSAFDNGLKLRNKYIHGNQSGIIDEKIHEQNYIIFLKLFIILAIKIKDDFSLKEQQEQMNQEA